MVSQSLQVSQILKNYNLCQNCTRRLILKSYQKQYQKSRTFLDRKCYICKDIFETLDTVLFNIYEKINTFDFKTSNLGLTIKHSYLERDDYLKSKFKIKGIENIKSDISNELAKKITKKRFILRDVVFGVVLLRVFSFFSKGRIRDGNQVIYFSKRVHSFMGKTNFHD